MKSIVVVNDVSFELPNGRLLFSDLRFSLERGITALVGPNGVGKTCLANLLVGLLEPTGGAIRRTESLAFFPQRELPREITVDEYLADSPWSEVREVLLGAVDRQASCTTLSGGQWMRVRLARAVGDRFLVLDEPTNDLDRQGREALLLFLKEHSGGALLISHDRECLALCDDVLELSNRGLTKFGGGWAAYEDAKALERGNLQSKLDKAKRDRDAKREERTEQLDRQEKRNRRGVEAAARGGMPKILIGARKRRAQVTSGKIDAATMERANDAVHDAYEAFSELKVDPVMFAELAARRLPSQRLVAEAVDFNVRFGDWLYPKDLSFAWRGNLRIALKGANGSGKSTLLNALRGAALDVRGELRRGGLTTLDLDQRCATLDDSLSVLDNVRESARLDEGELRNGLAKFLFMKDSVFQTAGTLSGGERLRAALAKGLLGAEKPELLILDEPTNNLDLANIEFLEGLVKEFRGAVIVVSHDETFLRNAGIEKEFVLPVIDK